MRFCHLHFISAATLLMLLLGCTTPASPTSGDSEEPPVTTRHYPDPADLPDGWAGSAGRPAQPGGAGAVVTTVRTRGQLIRALNAGGSSPSSVPKVIVIDGLIDLCSDTADQPLSAADFMSRANLSSTYPTYSDWVTAYAASSPLGGAAGLAAHRTTLANLQKAVVTIKVGSNTTLLGLGADSGVVRGSLLVDGVTNVVIRNVSISNARDDFPAWDGSENLFNSEYDNLSITNSTWVWVDHCRLDDGADLDSAQPSVVIGDGTTVKKWVVHDGLLDVVRGANFVTISWNQIRNHDKTMLIGNSDSASDTDSGKLKVTLHHNAFEGTKQRLPRVRFGQVHVYNNWYSQVTGYAVGVGDHSRIVSQNNVFENVTTAFSASDETSNPGYYTDAGSLGAVYGKAPATAELVGWEPSSQYSVVLTPVGQVKALVQAQAGPGRW